MEAPFNISDLLRIRFWPSSMRRIVKNWLLTFGLYAGVLEFYLWDLVPAVYLMEPLLFEQTTVFLQPSIDKLAEGMLSITTSEYGRPVVMPKHIRNRTAFMQALFTAWENIAATPK